MTKPKYDFTGKNLTFEIGDMNRNKKDVIFGTRIVFDGHGFKLHGSEKFSSQSDIQVSNELHDIFHTHKNDGDYIDGLNRIHVDFALGDYPIKVIRASSTTEFKTLVMEEMRSIWATRFILYETAESVNRVDSDSASDSNSGEESSAIPSITEMKGASDIINKSSLVIAFQDDGEGNMTCNVIKNRYGSFTLD